MLGGTQTHGIPDLPDDTNILCDLLGNIQGKPHPRRLTPHKVRTPLLMATLLSPLTLLMAIRMDNQTFKRDSLFSVGYLSWCLPPVESYDFPQNFTALGSWRPPVIRNLEDIIWREVFYLAACSTVSRTDILGSIRRIIESPEFDAGTKVTKSHPAYLTFGPGAPSNEKETIQSPLQVLTLSDRDPSLDCIVKQLPSPNPPSGIPVEMQVVCQNSLAEASGQISNIPPERQFAAHNNEPPHTYQEEMNPACHEGEH